MSAKRIAKELNDLKKDALPQGCTVGPALDENVYEWSASIGAFARLEGWKARRGACRDAKLTPEIYSYAEGPPDSPYAGGVFQLHITLPADYPFRPPRVVFMTKIYHANINNQGGICRELRAERPCARKPS